MRKNHEIESMSIADLVNQYRGKKGSIDGDAKLTYPSLLMSLVKESIRQICDGAIRAAKNNNVHFYIHEQKESQICLEAIHNGIPITDSRFSYDPMPSQGKGSLGLGIYIAGTTSRRLGGDITFQSDFNETRVRLILPKNTSLEDYIKTRHEYI